MKRVFSLTLLVMLLLALMPVLASAQDGVECAEEVVVQKADWLSKYADKYFGNVFSWPAIMAWSNQAAQAEPGKYDWIDNPDLLIVGWSVCIPSAEDAEAFLAAYDPNKPELLYGGGAMAQATPQRGGTLRTEYNWMPYVSDPAIDGVGTGTVGLAIAEPLVWVNGAGVPQPNLIKSWEASEDATEWTLYLQEGVTFNNGKPFGADDVIWNFQHWLDPDVGSSMAARLDWLSPEGMEKVDDLTIKLTLNRPYADVPLALYDYPSMIAPEGGWTDFYSGNPADAIGTGPFLMEEFIPDERMVLVRNPNYWRMGADGQPLPYVDKVIVTAGWTDAARLAALTGGEADLLDAGPGIIPDLEANGDIRVVRYDTGWITPIVMRLDMEPYSDARVRQALRLVQDRQKIRDLVFPDGRVGYDHWIRSDVPEYCPDTDVSGHPQDIAKAKALLAEAGYPDGIEVELALPDGDFRVDLAQVYKEMAAEAGIDVSINLVPSSAFWDQWQEWPFSISGWNGRIPATISPSLALRCDSVEAGWGETYYCNEEFERILDEAESTVDVDKKRELLCDIQRIMQEDAPMLIPFWAVEYDASRNNVHMPDDWSRGGPLWHWMWLTGE
jgi:peptide/nickel transport system substrate-binding protein